MGRKALFVLKMLKGLIGQKLNMTQMFDKHGRVVPATRIKVMPNRVFQVKTYETDGYKAVQIGIGEKKKAGKSALGHSKKANVSVAPRILKEVAADGEVKAGIEIKVDEVFRKGSLVDIVGTSKGKGFAGGVKRWGFSGGPKTHGQSDRHRAPGSIGAGTTPGRVYKGLKMAGHLGSDRVTVQSLEIMDLDKETGEILVGGSIPGAIGSFVLIEKSGKKKKTYHEPEIPQIPVIGGKEVDSGQAEEGEKPEAEKSEGGKVEASEPKTEEATPSGEG